MRILEATKKGVAMMIVRILSKEETNLMRCRWSFIKSCFTVYRPEKVWPSFKRIERMIPDKEEKVPFQFFGKGRSLLSNSRARARNFRKVNSGIIFGYGRRSPSFTARLKSFSKFVLRASNVLVGCFMITYCLIV
jgi:hypothetical protein